MRVQLVLHSGKRLGKTTGGEATADHAIRKSLLKGSVLRNRAPANPR